MVKAAKTAIKGRPFPVDIGSFNRKMFVYVAAFGAIAEVSYKTSQERKNILGHTAYIIEALKSIRTIKTHHMILKCDEEVIEGDFIHGCNNAFLLEE
jgi:diacylglycerol kinase family enzyme